MTRARGNRTETVVPRPTSLSIERSPPCSRAKDWASGNPSPVPSFGRELRLLARPKGVSATLISSSDIPSPVSLTSIRYDPPASIDVRTKTRASAGANLTALESRFVRIWRIMRRSAVSAASPADRSALRLIPDSSARARTSMNARSTTSATSTDSSLNS